ncbi:hypothetical protein [Blastococcus brunescens]|uniref:Uncharacterized protein n=1 Tax=Blastococcus brunescens TaxID=1564165 RepID=A0ABZ1B0N0_9ACTN|nr:hypothetical protein [Blastococcus sp. BMG 8361]WRL64340.1 hypothetical protein U6N30_00260 [Blastococcus sp. BMG 8361]
MEGQGIEVIGGEGTLYLPCSSTARSSTRSASFREKYGAPPKWVRPRPLTE